MKRVFINDIPKSNPYKKPKLNRLKNFQGRSSEDIFEIYEEDETLDDVLVDE